MLSSRFAKFSNHPIFKLDFRIFRPMSTEAGNPHEPHHSEAIAEGQKISLEQFKEEVLRDYRVVMASREMSLMGRKEVLTGKAKFGIFGDGKELAQVALAKTFRRGDWRSGYYRDQTWMMALGELNVGAVFLAAICQP
jgi:TPP-dependent pyruvate/acetoin dehydrogenase alpha subunit